MQELNKSELEAMRVFWNHGELKPAEIQRHFSWDIDNGTLRSTLRVLVEKGLATRRKNGKAYCYRATASGPSVLSAMARRMAHVFTGGSTAGLIAQLMETEKLSPGEIAELRRVAATKAVSATRPRSRAERTLARHEGGRGS